MQIKSVLSVVLMSILICTILPSTCYADTIRNNNDWFNHYKHHQNELGKGPLFGYVTVHESRYTYNIFSARATFLRKDVNDKNTYLCYFKIWDERSGEFKEMSVIMGPKDKYKFLTFPAGTDWDRSCFKYYITFSCLSTNLTST